jgi:hypothetical protein
MGNVDFKSHVVLLQRIALSRHNVTSRNQLLSIASMLSQLDRLRDEFVSSVKEDEDVEENNDALARRLIGILGLQVKENVNNGGE